MARTRVGLRKSGSQGVLHKNKGDSKRVNAPGSQTTLKAGVNAKGHPSVAMKEPRPASEVIALNLRDKKKKAPTKKRKLSVPVEPRIKKPKPVRSRGGVSEIGCLARSLAYRAAYDVKPQCRKKRAPNKHH